MLKYHNVPTVNESRDHHFSKTSLVVCGERESFGKRRGENEIERKRDIVGMKTDLNTTLFIDRILIAYYLLYLFIFIIL